SRSDALDSLAGELADQRANLVEQFRRLAAIENDWQCQRDHAADELEVVARRLVEQQHSLDERDRQLVADETSLKQRTAEMEATRQDLMVWRAQLTARDHAFTTEHERTRAIITQQSARLQEQLAELEQLRARWQACRQQEIDALQERRAAADEEKT